MDLRLWVESFEVVYQTAEELEEKEVVGYQLQFVEDLVELVLEVELDQEGVLLFVLAFVHVQTVFLDGNLALAELEVGCVEGLEEGDVVEVGDLFYFKAQGF